jgi:tRNA pseudouridine55 synthase
VGRRRTNGRNINGILLLDKPAGITSNRALQIVKRIYKANKAGHTGNLDPLATGLLPICLGEATKVSGYLLDSDKRYLASCTLGVKTNTADAEGEIIETRPVGDYSEEMIQQILHQFIGEIEQIPPMHSALKVNGQPLYKLAHKGEVVERKPRKITIYDIRFIQLENNVLDLEVFCSKGTYIRTLAEDIGERLGCGAHISALRRSLSGPFQLEHAVGLAELEHLAEDGLEEIDSFLLRPEEALLDWPEVCLSEHSAHYVQQGQAVQVSKAPTEGLVRLHAENGQFLGVGQVMDDGKVTPKRLIRSN